MLFKRLHLGIKMPTRQNLHRQISNFDDGIMCFEPPLRRNQLVTPKPLTSWRRKLHYAPPS